MKLNPDYLKIMRSRIENGEATLRQTLQFGVESLV